MPDNNLPEQSRVSDLISLPRAHLKVVTSCKRFLSTVGWGRNLVKNYWAYTPGNLVQELG